MIDAIRVLLAAGEAEGSIRAGLDPDDVLLLMGAVWRVPPGKAGHKQAERLLDLVVDSLRVEPGDAIGPSGSVPESPP